MAKKLVNQKKPEKNLKPTRLSRNGTPDLRRQRSLLLALGCLATVGFFSSSLVWAQETLEIPETAPAETVPAEPAPQYTAPAEPAPAEAAPQYTEPEPVIEPQSEVPPAEPEAPTANDYVPPPVAEEPSWEAQPHSQSEPEYSGGNNDSAPPVSEAPLYLPENPEVALPPVNLPEPAGSNSPSNGYIDSTNYQVGATDSYEAPNTVLFSERGSGCEAALRAGQNVPNSLCNPGAGSAVAAGGNNAPAPVGGSDAPNAWQPPANVAQGEFWHNNAPLGSGSNQETVAGYNRPIPVNEYGQPAVSQGSANSENSGYNSGYNSGDNSGYNSDYAAAPEPSYYGDGYGGSGILSNVASVIVGALDPGAMSNSGMAYYNRTMRPSRVLGNGNTRLLFPLSLPAPITSLFGWRQHPVLGYGRFHTGVDLGAEIGTPVVAAFAGKVAIADWLGGYGIAVVLDHGQMKQETLYGHLSEFFVKPGEWVEQGEVIGRVGSTGMSTGPHLHFELRKLKDDAWTADDPGTQIQYGLAQLMKTLQVGRSLPMPKISAQMLAQLSKDAEGSPKLPPLPPGFDVQIPNLSPPFTLYPQNADIARK